MKKKKTKRYNFYVVFAGILPGVYESWGDVKANVEGYQYSDYKGYATRREAEIAFSLRYPSGSPNKNLKWQHPRLKPKPEHDL
ncbi:RNase H1/viroplasmin domain-containing protein [Rheinheimera hassiensis]|uniref:RNase H1/viroplasmin domain-containing protein n=1 Tax=Rheinheimera hassiensis TaxID=1193627 RepID=UPI001F065B67|nr:RNase H1/viroplasmin domain-containing protein [Rheinheimera hassiensis]